MRSCFLLVILFFFISMSALAADLPLPSDQSKVIADSEPVKTTNAITEKTCSSRLGGVISGFMHLPSLVRFLPAPYSGTILTVLMLRVAGALGIYPDSTLLNVSHGLLVLSFIPHVKRLLDQMKMYDPDTNTTFAVTSRTTFMYYFYLNLLGYDFRGKKVLDIGPGDSKFVESVNHAFKKSGSFAVSIDKLANPELTSYSQFVRGDLFHLPLLDASFDLVISSWLVHYFVPLVPLNEVQKKDYEELFKVFSELLRVTKKGGEVHIGIGRQQKKYFSHPLFVEWVSSQPQVKKFTPPADWQFQNIANTSTMKIELH